MRPIKLKCPSNHPQTGSGTHSDHSGALNATGTQAETEYQGTYWNGSAVGYNSQPSYTARTITSSSSAMKYYQPHATSDTSFQGSRPRRGPLPRGQGASIEGEYIAGGPVLHYETIDSSYHVRNKAFFNVGRVFAVMWNETAGETKSPIDYKTSTTISCVKYADNRVHTTVRRFVVVKTKQEFSFACPIFTYKNQGTTKNGVRPAQHAVIYSWGRSPQLLPGETGITKASIGVVQTEGIPVLSRASRIYFGIHHPVQYNVRVKDMGYVVPDHIPTLIGNWREED